MGLAYPPNPIGLFGAIGLVPLLLALERAKSYRQFIGWSYLALVIFSGLSTWWVGSWQARTEPFLMISCVALILVHPFFFLVPLVIYRAVRQRTSKWFALAFLPFFWCGGEYLHALSDASYPWLTLGNTQTYNLYYIQFIEFTGIWGVSFILMVQNCIITAMFFALRQDDARRSHILRLGTAILVATVLLPYLHGYFTLSGLELRKGMKKIAVTVVQPNVDPWDKWGKYDTTDHVALNGGMSLEAERQQKPDMFLWSETAIPHTLTQPGSEGRMAELQEMINQARRSCDDRLP